MKVGSGRKFLNNVSRKGEDMKEYDLEPPHIKDVGDEKIFFELC